MSHREHADSIGAYVLDALEPEERRAFEAHLRACPICRAEVDSLRAAAADLALAIPPALPSGRLRDRIAAIPTVARIESPPSPRPIPWLVRWPALAVAAALVVALGGLLASNIQMKSEMASMKQSMAMHQQVLTVLADPATKMTMLRGQEEMGRVTFVYNRQRNAGVLVISTMKTPPAGQAYQLWLLLPEPASAGMFKPQAEMHVVPVTGNIAMSKGIGITAEPEQGSPRPTSQPLLIATW